MGLRSSIPDKMLRPIPLWLAILVIAGVCAPPIYTMVLSKGIDVATADATEIGTLARPIEIDDPLSNANTSLTKGHLLLFKIVLRILPCGSTKKCGFK